MRKLQDFDVLCCCRATYTCNRLSVVKFISSSYPDEEKEVCEGSDSESESDEQHEHPNEYPSAACSTRNLFDAENKTTEENILEFKMEWLPRKFKYSYQDPVLPMPRTLMTVTRNWKKKTKKKTMKLKEESSRKAL